MADKRADARWVDCRLLREISPTSEGRKPPGGTALDWRRNRGACGEVSGEVKAVASRIAPVAAQSWPEVQRCRSQTASAGPDGLDKQRYQSDVVKNGDTVLS